MQWCECVNTLYRQTPNALFPLQRYTLRQIDQTFFVVIRLTHATVSVKLEGFFHRYGYYESFVSVKS